MLEEPEVDPGDRHSLLEVLDDRMIELTLVLEVIQVHHVEIVPGPEVEENRFLVGVPGPEVVENHFLVVVPGPEVVENHFLLVAPGLEVLLEDPLVVDETEDSLEVPKLDCLGFPTLFSPFSTVPLHLEAAEDSLDTS